MIQLKQLIPELKTISRGIFKGYSEHKGRVIVPLGIPASKNGFDSRNINKLTVGVGIATSQKTGFIYSDFDLWIMNDEIVSLIKSNGKMRIKVRLKKDPNYFRTVIKSWQDAINDKIKKQQ